MESKVLLYDSNDVKIGETFIRRAKQLVKQQRASWSDDSQKAIKFLPGMENLDVDGDSVEEMPPHTPQNEDWLTRLAEKRIRNRKFFMWHSIIFIPGLFIIFVLFAGFLDEWIGGAVSFDGVIGFVYGSWITAYGIHAYFFIKNRRSYGFTRSERQKRELANEIAMIKANMTE